MRALTADQLRGVWAAVPTAWTPDCRLDSGALEENVDRYQAYGVAGVYAADSDGEFYAIEIEQFRELARVFGRAMEKVALDAAMGVTWSHTQGIIQRIQASLDAGIPNVHVAFPFWMPLAKPDIPRFFDDLAKAAPQARWIHYRTPRAHVLPSGVDYAELQRAHPEQFIGTKLVTTDIVEIVEVIAHAPALAHFVTEYSYVPAALAGARGLYSYWVNTLPEWTLETWRLCELGRWEEAMQRQAKLIRWETTSIRKLRLLGHNHGIIGKARAALGDFLVDSGMTQAPYYPVDAGCISELQWNLTGSGRWRRNGSTPRTYLWIHRQKGSNEIIPTDEGQEPSPVASISPRR